RRSCLCTLVGACPGAAPVLIGWLAVRGDFAPAAWVLYAILFLWQFPHFLAIGWLYREDYARRHAEDPRRGRERQGDLCLNPPDGPGPGGGELPPHPDGDGRDSLSGRGVAAWGWALRRRLSGRLRTVGGGGQAPPPRDGHLSPAAVPVPQTAPSSAEHTAA